MSIFHKNVTKFPDNDISVELFLLSPLLSKFIRNYWNIRNFFHEIVFFLHESNQEQRRDKTFSNAL